MKQMIIAALMIFSQMALAAPAKGAREITRDQAKDVLEHKDQPSKEKYISNIAELAGQTGNVKGLTENIKKALLQGDEDLLILVFKSIAKKDEAKLKFIAEASAGVKTVKEAQALAKLTDLANTENFKVEMNKEIEKGQSLSEAIKSASKAIGKTGKDEITLEKILDCLA